MPERRKGTTIFWEYFWKRIHGERRSGKDRRQSRTLSETRDTDAFNRAPSADTPPKEKT